MEIAPAGHCVQPAELCCAVLCCAKTSSPARTTNVAFFTVSSTTGLDPPPSQQATAGGSTVTKSCPRHSVLRCPRRKHPTSVLPLPLCSAVHSYSTHTKADSLDQSQPACTDLNDDTHHPPELHFERVGFLLEQPVSCSTIRRESARDNDTNGWAKCQSFN